MDEQEKVFDTTSIVMLLTISVANDAAEIFFDLLAATGIGLPGEAIMEPINFLVDCIVTPWFFIKCGFGGPTIAQLLDDFLSFVGVPGRTLSVAFGIYVANNPQSFLGRIGALAATVETGGEAALVSEGAEAAQAGERIIQEEERARELAAEAGAGAKAEGGLGEGAGAEKKTAEQRREEELEKKMEPEAEREPGEVAEEKIFEQTPGVITPENAEKEEDEEPVAAENIASPQQSNIISMEDIRRNPNAVRDGFRRSTRPAQKISEDMGTEEDASLDQAA